MKWLSKNITLLMLLLLGSSLLITSCNKDDEPSDVSKDPEILATIDDYLAADVILTDGIEQILLQIYSNNELNFTGESVDMIQDENDEEPDVIIEKINDNNTITVNFNEGKNIKGTVYKGTINGYLQGSFWVKGSELTLDFENFETNSTIANGLVELSSFGVNPNNNNSYSLSVKTINLEVKYKNYSLTRNLDKVITAYTNGTWNDMRDDWYTVSGTGGGVNHEGRVFITTVIKPITKYLSCGRITSGEILFRNDGKAPVEVDFGNGNCSTAAITIKAAVNK